MIFSAHWDHLGIGPAVNGDSIYNGAMDNAAGVRIDSSVLPSTAGRAVENVPAARVSALSARRVSR